MSLGLCPTQVWFRGFQIIQPKHSLYLPIHYHNGKNIALRHLPTQITFVLVYLPICPPSLFKCIKRRLMIFLKTNYGQLTSSNQLVTTAILFYIIREISSAHASLWICLFHFIKTMVYQYFSETAQCSRIITPFEITSDSIFWIESRKKQVACASCFSHKNDLLFIKCNC